MITLGQYKKISNIIAMEQCKGEHKVFKEGIVDKCHVLSLLSMLEFFKLSL